MPAPDQDIMLAPARTLSTVSLEPALNAIHSLMLLAKTQHIAELGGWVEDSVLAMSALERQRHRLVMIGFYYAVLPERSWPAFTAYLDHLTAMPPAALRDKLINAYVNLPCLPESASPAQDMAVDEILESAETFLEFLGQRFSGKHLEPDLERHAYAYLVDPPSMHKMITSHLRHVWDSYLATEWQRVEPMLNDAVRAFSGPELQALDRIDAFRFVTGQTPDQDCWPRVLEESGRLVFIPSAHVGPYLGRVRFGDTVGIIFGARLPEGALFEAPDLSRAEMLTRLGTLADDTRLRILRLVAEEGEKCSQEIRQRLQLSQSATSRHLSQLSATGYLQTRRLEGANCYQLNGSRIEDTLRALASYLTAG
jgi:DNA-binding transcriptional ArsR family regulator